MQKLLTIIVPTYNMQDYLRHCLDSLIVSNEWLDLLEVLVINDGSKDKSSEIGHEFEMLYPNTFVVIDKENGNYGSCINKGLEIATGKYVKVLDSDAAEFDGFSRMESDGEHFTVDGELRLYLPSRCALVLIGE